MVRAVYMKTLSRRDFAVKRANHADRLKGSLGDHWVSTDQLKAISRAFLGSEPFTNAGSLVAAVGHRLAYLLCYGGILRSDSTRKLEYSDLSTVFLEDEGSSACHLLVLTLGQGKTNKFGKYNRTGIMRHKEPDLDCFKGLAWLLVARHEVLKEPFPSFEHSADWFLLKVIRPMTHGRPRNQTSRAIESDDESEGDSDDEHETTEPVVDGPTVFGISTEDDQERTEILQAIINTDSLMVGETDPRTQEITYDSQRKAMKAALKAAGVQATSVMHLPRRIGASKVVQQCQNSDSARALGHWNQNDTMDNVYVQGHRAYTLSVSKTLDLILSTCHCSYAGNSAPCRL